MLAQRAASEGPRWTRAVEDHSAPIPEETTSELGGRSRIADLRNDQHLCHVLGEAGRFKKELRNEADLAVQHPALLAQTGQLLIVLRILPPVFL